jgi:hypothetical protein
MNKLQKILGIGTISLPLIFGGCDYIRSLPETRTEYSDVLHEDAKVVDVAYTPSRHGSGAGPSFGMTSGGDVAMGLSVTSVSIPKKYAVVFKCQHGKFIVEGEDEEHKKLWERLQEGEDVDVTYREIYETTYQDYDKDGKKEFIERKLIDYDFLDAQPK